ncbi:MAG TPA: DNA cytosine methyltransferase [Burkholderiales bacterium]|nr:DNA cytosine methyltransferase [Burkholderiales bacterium]
MKSEFGSFRAIDLFAGIGGIRLGFEKVFHNKLSCVFSSEIDKFSIKTYFANFNEIPDNDITKINEVEIPAHDIILAGFPCQAFSLAGLRKGFNDIRGTLFFDIARIAQYHKPKVLFLENVKGLITHNKGNTFQIINETLSNLGYKVYHKILNAKNFGVPQNRERIYIICFLDHNIKFEFPDGLNVTIKVGDILEENVDIKYTISDRLWMGHQRRRLEHKIKGNGFGYSLFNNSSEYTSTLSARYYKDGSEILIEQNSLNPRKITPREAARLQGFPDNFNIVVSDVQAYKQFGNSVSVPVIEAIAKNILKALNNEI